MPMHLDEERVQRFLHGELSSEQSSVVRRHIAICVECSTRVAGADEDEGRLLALLHAVDDPPPLVTSAAVVARARRRTAGWMRRAAGILVAVGIASAAYAAPGSPLRDLVGRILSPPRGPAATASAARALGPTAGIAMLPSARFTIEIEGERLTGIANISVGGGREVVVRAFDGSAVFTAGVDRLLIDDVAASASFEIEIPQAARRVEVRAGGRQVFLKVGAAITTLGEQDEAGRYRIPLSAAPGPK